MFTIFISRMVLTRDPLYSEALQDESIKVETAVNMMGLLCLLFAVLKSTSAVLHDKPTVLHQLAKNDKNVQSMIQDPDLSFQKEAEETLAEIYNEEMKEKLSALMKIMKRSKDWSDVGDYYLALQYALNLVDNGLDWGFNQRIGVEMLSAFRSVDNKYAERYLSFVSDSLADKSSRSVDDKE